MAAKLKAADIIENWPNRLEYTGLEKMLMAVSIALLAVTMVRLGLNYGSLPAEDIVHGTRVYLYLTTILMVALFWYLIEGTMLVAKGVWMGLPSFGIWAFMLVLFVSIGIYFYWLWRG